MQTIMSDYISFPQKPGLKMPLERVCGCALIFFPGNHVYFISGPLIRGVDDSKADRGGCVPFGIHFKFSVVPPAGDGAG